MHWSWVAIVGTFVCAGLAEFARPARPHVTSGARMRLNYSFAALMLATQFLLPLSVVGAAQLAWARGFGLSAVVGATPLVAAALYFLGRSFSAYWLHRAMHEVGALWRLHELHHSDEAIDLTTTFRDHPLSVLVTAATFIATALAIGCPLPQAIAVETLFFCWSIVTHANLRLPAALERALRLVLLTPELHAVHHEREPARAMANYGSSLVLWDKLFGTWLDADAARGPLGTESPCSNSVTTEILRPFRRSRSTARG